jgi:hypothetical protein
MGSLATTTDAAGPAQPNRPVQYGSWTCRTGNGCWCALDGAEAFRAMRSNIPTVCKQDMAPVPGMAVPRMSGVVAGGETDLQRIPCGNAIQVSVNSEETAVTLDASSESQQTTPWRLAPVHQGLHDRTRRSSSSAWRTTATDSHHPTIPGRVAFREKDLHHFPRASCQPGVSAREHCPTRT